MNRYESYKASGLDYLDSIPSHWNILPNKRLFTEYFGGAWGDDPKEDQETALVRVIRVTEFNFEKLVVSQSIPTIRSLELESDSRKLIKKYDLILEKSGGGEKTPVGRVVLVDREMEFPTINSNFTNICRPNTQLVNPKFLVYSFYSSYVYGQTVRNVKQTTGIQNLDLDGFMSEKSVLPPINEQRLIAKYLDRKNKTANSLIDKIQNKIKLIKEQRAGLISQCVTKGLNPNAEMKDSGVEWIGEVPKHWLICPMYTLFNENKVKNKDGRLDVLTLSYGKIKYRDLSKMKGLIPESFDDYQVMDIESIIIRSTDLQNDHKSLRVGHVGVKGVITSAYLGLNPKQTKSTKFYYYLIHLADLKKVLYGLGGGLRQSLRYDDFKRFQMLNPPEDERESISAYLDRIDKRTDDLIEKLENKISLLNEYRKSLISSVVNGKVRITEDMV